MFVDSSTHLALLATDMLMYPLLGLVRSSSQSAADEAWDTPSRQMKETPSQV